MNGHYENKTKYTWCVSVSPSSQWPPACLIELIGLAPVPPSCPDICKAVYDCDCMNSINLHWHILASEIPYTFSSNCNKVDYL